jgi:hypothetical protein
MVIWQIMMIVMMMSIRNHHSTSSSVVVEAFTVQKVARVLIESAVAQSPQFATVTSNVVILKANTMDDTTTSMTTASMMNNSNATTDLKNYNNSTNVIALVNDDDEAEEQRLQKEIEAQASWIVDEMMEETCEIDTTGQTGGDIITADEICTNENQRIGFRNTLKSYVRKIEYVILGKEEDDTSTTRIEEVAVVKKSLTGDDLEQGCKYFFSSSPFCCSCL